MMSINLEEFGLSNYEARAYLTLVTKGTISASDLAYYSGLPRTKIYPTLIKLEKKKLVIISKNKPVMCTVIPPMNAFNDIIKQQIDKVNIMNQILKNLTQLNESNKQNFVEEKNYLHINIKNNLMKIQLMFDNTRSSIKIMADIYGLTIVSKFKKQLISLLRRNIDVKILIPSQIIGSEPFKTIPDSIKIRISNVIYSCFIFDDLELLFIDSKNETCEIFSHASTLNSIILNSFMHLWNHSLPVNCLYSMPKTNAQEIYKMIQLIKEKSLDHILNNILYLKNISIDIISLLEKNGIHIKNKKLQEIIDILDCILQITCFGHVTFDPATKNITIKSKLNNSSLPWVIILNEYLQRIGYITTVFYNISSGGNTNIKINNID